MNDKISLIYNPISGKGQAKQIANNVSAFLERKNFTTELIQSKRTPTEYLNEIDQFRESSLIIVIGGDGTILGTLPLLASTNIPVYMIPAGNESLFAQIYGMDRVETTLLNAIENKNIKKQYYGEIVAQNTNSPFYCMASYGLDSLTVKYIGARKGTINNFKYIYYGLKALLNLTNPTISVVADGEKVIDHKQGYLIVANSASYAHNLRLVPQATPDADTLTLAFLPNSNRFTELKKAIWMAQRKPAKLALQFFQAKNFAVTLHNQSYPLQVDGEYFNNQDIAKDSPLTFRIAPQTINVLTK